KKLILFFYYFLLSLFSSKNISKKNKVFINYFLNYFYMLKLDNYYKIVSSTFGLAYFIGLVVALLYILRGSVFIEPTSFINTITLANTLHFKNIYYTTMQNAMQLAIIPFSYLIYAVKFGFSHTILLTSSFLGQIKLLVTLIPLIFFFITYIIFSTIGLKLILYIIKLVSNLFLKTKKIKIKFFNKEDIKFLYIAIISLIIGTVIQTYLIRILFIFLINLKSIAYALIILIYIIFISLAGYVIYKTVKEVTNNKIENI
ncbi:MAG: hypothetical protein PHQ07_03975, partial [Candidatus ainarchaeum sp.]|nr:hypothetical protein [Candidatus ainarchaeum sp.]